MVCIFFAFQSLYAQQQFSGRVIDAQTKQAVTGATIKALKNPESSSSDKQGRVTLTNQADSISVSCIGYHTTVVAWEGEEIIVALAPSNNTLTEIVVSASREEQKRKNVPAAISKVDAATIKDTRATALYQLLNKVSGVYMVNLGNEQHTMAIRQPISYNALYLYLEDGLPIRPTGIFNHNALYEINMNSVRDIEVFKGPSSSLYGSNSIGGSVNFIGPNAGSGSSPEISVQGDGYNYYRADASGGWSQGKLAVYAAAYTARQRDSWQDYTDFDKYSASIKTSYAFTPATRLVFSATYNNLDTQTPGSLDSARFYGQSYASNQRFTYRKVAAFRASTRLDHTWNTSNATFVTAFFRDNSTGQLPAYYISDVRNESRQYIRSVGQENNQSFNSYGLLIQHRTNIKFLNSKLIGGFYLDNSPSTFYANFLSINKDLANNYYTGYTKTDSLIDDYRINLFNTAAFVQYELNPVSPLRLVAGLRYDNVRYSFKNSLPAEQTRYKQEQTDSYNIFAPKFGATYDLGKGRGIYANFSLGFQPPETGTMYNSRQVDRLKQATFYNYEIGGWLPLLNSKLALELNAYNMEGKNEIISVLGADNTTQNQNAGATRHTGIEYNLIAMPAASWQVRVGGTLARHTYLEYSEILSGKTLSYDGNRMANAPSWIANTELTWKPAFIEGFRSALEWQHLNKYYINSAISKSYQGYDVFNLRLGYELKSGFARGAGIWLNAINLMDKLYATNVTANQYGATYNAAAPRTFSLGISFHLQNKRHAYSNL